MGEKDEYKCEGDDSEHAECNEPNNNASHFSPLVDGK